MQVGAYNLNTQINSLLRQTEKIIEKHDAIDKAIGAKFNIFTILERDRSETRHSRLLAELLNPKGSHGQGGVYLKLFYQVFEEELKTCWSKNNNTFKIDIFAEKALVHTEQSNNIDGKQGFIDIVVETNEFAIVIENKIDAGDQDAQLERYEQSKKGKNILLIYLTLDGREPSLNAKGTLSQKSIVLMSYSFHIIKWLEICIKESATLPAVRETLAQYSKLLLKITNQNEETMDNELVELLLKDGNLRVADKLSKALPEVKAKIELKFWKKVKELLVPMLSEYDLIYRDTEDDVIFERIRTRQKSGVGIIWMYHNVEYAKGTLFNFALAYDNSNDKLYIGCYPCKPDGTIIQDSSRKCVKLLNEPFKANKHYEYFGQKRDFFGDGIFELLDPNKCDEMAEETVNDLIPFLEKLQQRIDVYFEINKQLG